MIIDQITWPALDESNWIYTIAWKADGLAVNVQLDSLKFFKK